MLFVDISVKRSQYEVDVIGQPAEGEGHHDNNHHLHHLRRDRKVSEWQLKSRLHDAPFQCVTFRLAVIWLW